MASRRVPALALLVASLVGGCALSPQVRPGGRYDPSRAYLFGRFMLMGNVRMGVTLEIRCRDGQVYDLEFAPREGLTMIQVKPSVCQVDRIVYAGARGLQDPELAGFRLIRNEFLKGGGVYYVGDYVVGNQSDTQASFALLPGRRGLEPGVRFTTTTTWRFGVARDDYAGATAELKQTFPGFSSAATEDRSTIPR